MMQIERREYLGLLPWLHGREYRQSILATLLLVAFAILTLGMDHYSRGVMLLSLMAGGFFYSSYPRYFNRLFIQSGLGIAYLLFFLPLIFTLRHYNYITALIFSAQFINYLAVAVLLFLLLQRGLEYLNRGVIALILIISVEALIDRWSGFSLFSLGKSQSGMGGLWHDQRQLGLFLGSFSGVILANSYQFYQKKERLSFLSIVLPLLVGITILLTGGLAGWIATFLTILLCGIWVLKDRKPSLIIIVLAAVFLLVKLSLLFLFPLLDRWGFELLTALGVVDDYREMMLLMPFWFDLLQDFSAYGWFGTHLIGEESFYERLAILRTIPLGLRLLVESGVVGLLLIIGLEIYLLVKTYRQRSANGWFSVAFILLFPLNIDLNINFSHLLVVAFVLSMAFSRSLVDQDKLR